jgi:hypothetical protein
MVDAVGDGSGLDAVQICGALWGFEALSEMEKLPLPCAWCSRAHTVEVLVRYRSASSLLLAVASGGIKWQSRGAIAVEFWS